MRALAVLFMFFTAATAITNVLVPVFDGSGCPSKANDGSRNNVTITQNALERPTNVTIRLDQGTFSVSFSPNSPVIDRRRNCIMLIQISNAIPGEYQYTVTKATYKGFINLTNSTVNAYWSSNYYFSGTMQQKNFDQRFEGPVQKDFDNVHANPIPPEFVATCGRNEQVAIVNTLEVGGEFTETDEALLESEPNGALEVTLQLAWTKCRK